VRELKPPERAAGAPAGTHGKKNIAVQFLPELVFFCTGGKKRQKNRTYYLEGSFFCRRFRKASENLLLYGGGGKKTGILPLESLRRRKKIPIRDQMVQIQADFLFRPYVRKFFSEITVKITSEVNVRDRDGRKFSPGPEKRAWRLHRQ